MLKHNLLIVYRNFKRFKSTFFINLVGLSTGLACALLIYLWVSDELSVDKFHANDKQLYQVVENTQNADEISTGYFTPDLLAETMAAEMPEIKYASAVVPATEWLGDFSLTTGEKKVKASVQFAGEDFFNIFSYNMIAGNKSKVISDRNTAAISETLSEKLFGTAKNAMGNSFEWEIAGQKKLVTVTGIFKDVPANSTAKFDVILSYDNWINPPLFGREIHWGNHAPYTYLVLNEGVDDKQFNVKIKNYLKSKNKYSNVTLFIRPYSDSYLYDKYENGVLVGGRIEYVKLFSIIAIFLLLIACINFMNLSTAKVSARIKEIGIKKSVGAGRKSLVMQYLGESIIMAVLSLLIALILVESLLSPFNMITGKQLSLLSNPGYIIHAVVIAILTGIVSGSYPALYLSRFNPVSILKGNINNSVGELWTRRGLVIFQFTLSVILIVSVLVVYKQVEFIQNKNLGYNKENILYFPSEGGIPSKYETFIDNLKRIPGVVNAAGTRESIIGQNSATLGVSWEGKNPENNTMFFNTGIDFNFIETVGYKIKEGRSFNRNYGADSTAVIINESAVKVIGYKNPVGKSIVLWGENRQIIGVLKNFHNQSLHETVQPYLFILRPNEVMNIVVRIRPGNQFKTISRIGDLYDSFNPGYTFDYKFLDEDYQKLYASEMRVSVLSKYFAGIAILISCLGLFGLTAFTAERKTKEIGIRKILGAGEFKIIYMLSAGFTKMVLISITVALPLSYLLVKNWLDSFAYRVELSLWYFISAAVATLLITWFTVGLQAIKAARINPAVCLRNE